MKIMYIDSQNIHKSLQDIGWIIDRALFFEYAKRKFMIDKVKIFFGYVKRYKNFYTKLERIWYEVIFKNTLILPDWTTKGNVDIDIAIISLIDLFECWLTEAYLVSWDWDYNTLIDLFKERNVFWRVLIPSSKKSSKLLKKSAWANIQNLNELQYLLEKKNPTHIE